MGSGWALGIRVSASWLGALACSLPLGLRPSSAKRWLRRLRKGGDKAAPPPPSPRRAVITCETLGETHGAPSEASVLDSSLLIAI